MYMCIYIYIYNILFPRKMRHPPHSWRSSRRATRTSLSTVNTLGI